MTRKEIALVVPTIRENCLNDFIERWNLIGLFDHVDLIIMEDNPTRTFKTPHVSRGDVDAVTHLCWTDIDSELGDESWVIPRRSDTVRSFAYLKAWQLGYKFVMTLDDDCYPTDDADGLIYDGQAFVNEHLKSLTKRSRWFNTLNKVTPRGIPYYNRGTSESIMVNHGLWTNVLDYDAPRQLVAPTKEEFSFDSRVVPAGSYFPMCGMNVMWRAEATPLMYHLLMGQWNGGKDVFGNMQSFKYSTAPDGLWRLPFDRFGDIWCGILMKRCVDLAGMGAATGMPYIRHERASNPFTNLRKEANGLEVNEKFWEYIDVFSPEIPSRAHERVEFLAAIYLQLAAHVAAYDVFKEHVPYFKRLGMAMRAWAKFFIKTEGVARRYDQDWTASLEEGAL